MSSYNISIFFVHFLVIKTEGSDHISPPVEKNTLEMKYIAFLRGINVGGHRKILMADLRMLFESLGYSQVSTYIQSGNVLFASERESGHAENISKAIQEKYGWEVPVIVKTTEALRTILEACPFSEAHKGMSYFILLDSKPQQVDIGKTQAISYPKETFVITDTCVYYVAENGYRNAKCDSNFFERKLKVIATARNHRTVAKLLTLAS